jgi:hypothetical protein
MREDLGGGGLVEGEGAGGGEAEDADLLWSIDFF